MASKRALEEDSMFFSDDDVDLPLLKRKTVHVQSTKPGVEDMFSDSDDDSNEPGAPYFTSLNSDSMTDSVTGSTGIYVGLLESATNQPLAQSVSSPPSSEEPPLTTAEQPELINLDLNELVDIEMLPVTHQEPPTLTTLQTAIITNFESCIEAYMNTPSQSATDVPPTTSPDPSCTLNTHDLHSQYNTSLETTQHPPTNSPEDPQVETDANPYLVSHKSFQGSAHGPAGFQNTARCQDFKSSSSDSYSETFSAGGMENEEQPPRHCLVEPIVSKYSDSKLPNLFQNDLGSTSTQHDRPVALSKPPERLKDKEVCCIIEILVSLPFSQESWSETERIDLIKSGRPTPEVRALNLTANLYQQFSWLAACQKLKLLFCWPCLLFAKGRSHWRKGLKQSTGTTMNIMYHKHEKNVIHIASSEALTRWVANNLKERIRLNPEMPSDMPPIIDLSQDSDDLDLDPPLDVNFKAQMKKNSLAIQPILGMPRFKASKVNMEGRSAPAPRIKILRVLKKSLYSGETKLVLPMSSQLSELLTANPMSPEKCEVICEQPVSVPSSSLLIRRLQGNHFVHGKWTDDQREAIIGGGRPCPPIEGMIEQRFGPGTSPAAVRYCKSYYKKFPWLAGSSEMARLFCWPCLLFTRGHGLWTHEGFLNIKVDISWCAEKHALTQEHMEATLRLKMYEQIIKKQAPPVPLSPIKWDFTVVQKRELLRYVIDIICFFKKRADDYKPLLCIDIMGLIAHYDRNLKILLEKVTTDNVLLTEVTTYAGNICSTIDLMLKNRILKELEEAAFVSIILKSVSIGSRIAVIVRYASGDQQVFERFIKFVEASDGATLLNCIHATIAEIACDMKLVGFAYDGAVLIPSEIQPFNCKMNEKYISSFFFHYTNFNFKTLIQQSLTRSTDCIRFFQKLNDLTRFFEGIPNKEDAFTLMSPQENLKEIKEKFSEFSSGSIETVWSNYFLISAFLQGVIAQPRVLRTDAILQEAVNILEFLGSTETRFLMELISKIIATVDTLSVALQGPLEVEKWKALIQTSVSTLMEMRIGKFDEIYSAALNVEPTAKNCLHDGMKNQEEKAKFLEVHSAVLEWSSTFVKSWTRNIDSWAYFNHDTKNDKPSNKLFINKNSLMRKYFPLLDTAKLRPQMNFMHSNYYFKNKTPFELLKAIADVDMIPTLSELYKFLLLILTVPLTPYPSSREVAVKRISSYVKRRLNATCDSAQAYMEQDILSLMQKEGDFHDRILNYIVEHFGRKELAVVPHNKKIIEIL